MIPFTCQHCGRELEGPESRIGQELICPGCRGRTVLRVSPTPAPGRLNPSSAALGRHPPNYYILSAGGVAIIAVGMALMGAGCYLRFRAPALTEMEAAAMYGCLAGFLGYSVMGAVLLALRDIAIHTWWAARR